MAQDNWLNLVVDPSMAAKPDNANHLHTVALGTAAYNDVSLCWDSAKIPNLNALKSAVAALMRTAAQTLP